MRCAGPLSSRFALSVRGFLLVAAITLGFAGALARAQFTTDPDDQPTLEPTFPDPSTTDPGTINGADSGESVEAVSDTNIYSPGPNGAARIGAHTLCVYGRHNPDNHIWVRITDGPYHGGWQNNLPASTPSGFPMVTLSYPAATTVWNSAGATKISVFARINSVDPTTNNKLFVTQTSAGNTAFQPWKNLNVSTDAAPAAVCWKNGTNYHTMVFWRDIPTHKIYYMWSTNDGYNVWSPPCTAIPTFIATSGPTAVILNERPNVFPQPTSPCVGLFFRINAAPKTNIVLALVNMESLTSWGYPSDINGLPTGDSYTQQTTASPTASMDPCISSTVGGCIISGHPSTPAGFTEWGNYAKPEFLSMRAGIIKFQMDYDNRWYDSGGNPVGPHEYICNYGDVTSALNTANFNGLNVPVVIFRTAESMTTPEMVKHFMGQTTAGLGPGMVFSDGGNIQDLANYYVNTKFIIEIGNEPDNVPAQPLWGVPSDLTQRMTLLRDRAIATANQLQSQFPRFQFVVSLPTLGHGQAAVDQFCSSALLAAYPAYGVHAYGDNGFAWNSSADNPLGMLDYTLARLPYGKQILMTEAGIHSTAPWSTKGSLMRGAWWTAPASVRAWTYFAVDSHPEWNMYLHYCVDKTDNSHNITDIQKTVDLGTGARYLYIAFNRSTPSSQPVVPPTIAIRGVTNVTAANGVRPINSDWPITAADIGDGWVRLNVGANQDYYGVPFLVPPNTYAGGGRVASVPCPTTQGFPCGAVLGAR